GYWHQGEARAATRRSEWFAVVFHLERFKASPGDGPGKSRTPAQDFELSAAYHNFAARLSDLSRYAEAESAFRQALAILDRLVADNPKGRLYRRDRANTLIRMSFVLQARSLPKEAETTARQSL